MTTAERARQLAREWHCTNCAFSLRDCNNINRVSVEIAAIMELLVDLKPRVAHTADCVTWSDSYPCNCGAKALIERIDKTLGGEHGKND